MLNCYQVQPNMTEAKHRYVHVLYDFNYVTDDGRPVWMREGEEFLLLNQTNDDWWQVIRDGENRPFYAPASYMETRESLQKAPSSRSSLSDQKPSSGSRSSLCDDTNIELRPSKEQLVKKHNDSSQSMGGSRENGLGHNSVFSLSFSNPLCADEEEEDEEHLNSYDEYLISGTDDDELCTKNYGDDGMKSAESTEDSLFMSSEEHSLERGGSLSPIMPPSTPIYANLPFPPATLPPLPSPGVTPLRILLGHWAEYTDNNGRKYYYNSFTRETSWKPPRRPCNSHGLRGGDSTQSEESLTEAPDPPPKLKSSIRKSKNDKRQETSPAKEGSLESVDSAVITPNSQFAEAAHGFETSIPPGYDVKYDEDSTEEYYVNSVTKKKFPIVDEMWEGGQACKLAREEMGEAPEMTETVETPYGTPEEWPEWLTEEDKNWFHKLDDCGRSYFFEENGTESFWELPEVDNQVAENEENVQKPESANSETHKQDTIPQEAQEVVGALPSHPCTTRSRVLDRGAKARSMVVLDVKCLTDLPEASNKSSSLPRGLSGPQWSLLQEGGLVISRQGTLNKTKVIEGGRRLRKNWSQSFVVLTDHFLLFYKDMKSAQMQGPQINKPEICVDLAGASVEWSPDKSSKRNVFQISTVLRQQVLLQDDNAQTSKEWFETIRSAISKLPSGYRENAKEDVQEAASPQKEDESKKNSKLARSKSTKQYKRNNSNDDLQCSAERKRKIRDKLRQFFLRRPSMESLREKGIIKDEPVFGCKIQALCNREKSFVPKFVQKCIHAIEKNDLTADGLYRASGNLSQVQKIRFQVNQDDYSCLYAEEDVHVLTGALKMFFRDMKEPLFPFKTFSSCLAAISCRSSKMKLKALKEVINGLPPPNYETLKFLLNHLLKVTKHSDQNRMHIQNLAIVFGPTLLWPETESTNLAVDMMHQNQIIEFLLLEYDNIFR